MKTLIINGSPRKNGDTVSLLKILKEKLNGEIKTVNTYYDNIKPCVDCRFCWKNKGCCIEDDMQSVYDYLVNCDNVIIASPMYFSEVTGQTLNFASRLQTYYAAKYKRNADKGLKSKRGAVILVGGGDGEIDKAFLTCQTILKCMDVKEIQPLVSSHNTDNVPAIKDKVVIEEIYELVTYFNKFSLT